MIEVKKNGIILEKTKLGFENVGVLNPAVIKIDKYVYLLYRAVSKGNYSTIGFCKMDVDSNIIERHDIPLLFPTFEYESHGIEDPRIVEIDDIFYLTFTAFDGVNALAALATSTDLIKWEKKGIIVPQICYKDFSHLAGSKGALNDKYLRYNEHEQLLEKEGKKRLLWDKNAILFPRKINGKFYLLHRIKPDIQLVCFENFDELNSDFWQHYLVHFKENTVMAPKYEHESSYIGGGCPPIETEAGWVIIYHGVHDSVDGYIYTVCAALLDLENPEKEITRLPYPLFKPEEKWELHGFVNNVCFPSGTALFDDTLHIYYGAADNRIAIATLSFSALLAELKSNIS
jgi:beta-1,2-mannobiose phosphorylase / 1,2-beta-oligomannan phosphorylase